jgi:hypothetical protein
MVVSAKQRSRGSNSAAAYLANASPLPKSNEPRIDGFAATPPKVLRNPMATTDVPELSISEDKLCFIVEKAREFDVKDEVTDPDDASNPTDDGMIAVLEDHKDDPVVQEITAVVQSMSVDEQTDLVTLAWLGRGDGSLDDWNDLRAEAARAHNNRTASYLLGMPLLADYLEEAMDQFGMSCEE